MKKLVTLVLLGALVAAAYGWFRQSVYHAAYRLSEALAARDVDAVETHADLDAWAQTAIDLGVGSAKANAGSKVGGALGQLANSFAELVGGVVAEAGRGEIKGSLRDAVRDGRFLGQFDVSIEPGIGAVAGVRFEGDDVAHLMFNAACKGAPVVVELRFERNTEHATGRWVSTGMDKAAAEKVAAACVRGAEAGGASATGEKAAPRGKAP